VRKDHTKALSKAGPSRRGSRPGFSLTGRSVGQWLAAFFVVMIVVDALAGERGLLAMLRVKKQYEALQGEIDRQRAENARLSEVARRLRDDPAAIEELVRRRHGLIRPGEKVFIVKDLAGSGRRTEN
jgi:cell division protein FtsB